MDVLPALYRLCLALWVGGVALFTLVVTPRIFRTRDRDEAGALVGALMPAYFRYGVVLGAVALVTRLAAGQDGDAPGFAAGTALLAAMTLAAAVQAWVLVPAAERLKLHIPTFATPRGTDPVRARFARLHGLSMALNLAVLLAGMALVLGAPWFGG